MNNTTLNSNVNTIPANNTVLYPPDKTPDHIIEEFHQFSDTVLNGVRLRCVFDPSSYLGYIFVDLPDTLNTLPEPIESPLKDLVVCYILEFQYPSNSFRLLPMPHSRMSIHFRLMNGTVSTSTHVTWQPYTELRHALKFLVSFINGSFQRLEKPDSNLFVREEASLIYYSSLIDEPLLYQTLPALAENFRRKTLADFSLANHIHDNYKEHSIEIDTNIFGVGHKIPVKVLPWSTAYEFHRLFADKMNTDSESVGFFRRPLVRENPHATLQEVSIQENSKVEFISVNNGCFCYSDADIRPLETMLPDDLQVKLFSLTTSLPSKTLPTNELFHFFSNTVCGDKVSIEQANQAMEQRMQDYFDA